jgi:hypothetical protein
MSAKPLMLEGTVMESPDTQDLRRQVQRLEDELRLTRRDLEDRTRERDQHARTIANLRDILSPLHRGLRALFGEIELAGIEDVVAPANGSVPKPKAEDPRWQSYKTRFAGVGAKIIDALLIHGEMRQTALAKFVGHHYDTVSKVARELRSAGALTSDGGVLRLKN